MTPSSISIKNSKREATRHRELVGLENRLSQRTNWIAVGKLRGVHILKLVVRDKNKEALEEILSSGISPNACSKYGESLVQKVCKSGHHELLSVFLDCGATVQVTDGSGRTPLHDACWGNRASFETFELIVKQDPGMIHLQDGTNALPLAHGRTQNYAEWISFLTSILDKYWKPVTETPAPPPLTQLAPNSKPIVGPSHALSKKTAKLVASGRMEPKAALVINLARCDQVPVITDEDSTSGWDQSSVAWDSESESGS